MKKWVFSFLVMILVCLLGAGQVLGASADQNKQQSKSKTVEWGKSTKTNDSSGSKSSFSEKAGKQAQKINEKSKNTAASSTSRKTSSESNSSDQKKPVTTTGKKTSSGSSSSVTKNPGTSAGNKTSSGLSSAAQKNRGAGGGASGSTAAYKEKPGSTASHKAGRDMDRQKYNQKVKESDQKISALQKRIQESKQREKDLNAEYRKTDQAHIVNHAPGAIGEEAGSKSSNTQRSHERGKVALAGPGAAFTESRDTWSKNVDAERKTRQGLEQDLKSAQSEKEGYQRKLRDLK